MHRFKTLLMRMLTFVMLILFFGCIGNAPPSWDTCTPDINSTHMSDLETLTFDCTAVDADGDSLIYTWLVNGNPVSAEKTFVFKSEAGTYTVEVRVSDGHQEISKLWNVWVIESIETGPLMEKIEEIRKLKFSQKVEWKYLSRQQFTEYFSKILEGRRNEMDQYDRLYTALHVFSPEKDLFSEYVKSSATIVGVYNHDEEAFYEVIVPDSPMAFRKLVVLEEMTHALTVQHFQVNVSTRDQKMAVNALIEGDAALVKKEYLRKLPTEEYLAAQNYGPEPPGADIDPLVLSLLMYPYGIGNLFVGYLFEQGVFDLVNEAYRNPPDSTEQVLHPEKFLAREKPIPLSVPDIPGWNVILRDVMGEGFYSIVLDQHLPSDEAREAASGWGGDICCLFEQDSQYIMVLNTAWDTAADAEEFLNAYLDFTNAWSGGYTIVEETPGRMLILAQDTWVLLSYSDMYVTVIESMSEAHVRMAESLMEGQK